MTKKTAKKRGTESSQFQKGQSGNPAGRPKKKPAKLESAFDIVIEKTLTVTQGGSPRELSVEEALHFRIYQEAIAGKTAACREVFKMIAKREKYLAKKFVKDGNMNIDVTIEALDTGNADDAMQLLDIVGSYSDWKGLDLNEERLMVKPWAAQAALNRRRGQPKLSESDLETILRETRDAEMLEWPRGTELPEV